VEWMGQAACKSHDTDIFVADGHDNSGPVQRGYAAAKAICKECPVQFECLEFALRAESGPAGGRAGIYGGHTPTERAEIQRRRDALDRVDRLRELRRVR